VQPKREKKKNHRHKSPVDWRAFYRSHGIHRSVVDMASLDAYHKLRATYLHSSINGYEYELLCFARFIGLHEFCFNKGIEQLTWVDADIPIFDPEFLGRVCLPLGYSIWSLTDESSFLNTKTCSEIGRFVDFMLDFYAKENRHALVRAIQAHGNNMSERPGITEQVRQAEPAFSELGIDPKHFSDMFLFSKFLQDTNAQAAAREQEEQKKKYRASTPSKSTTPRVPQTLEHSRTYIHQDENGGAIDPYFVPIISIKNRVPSPDTLHLCADETVWNKHYSVHSSKKSKAETRLTTQEKTQERFGLSQNEGGTWVPIPGAHFQGDDCKDRLLSMFAKKISKDKRAQ